MSLPTKSHHNPADFMTKAYVLSTLKTQNYGINKIGKYEISKYKIGNYGYLVI